MLKLPGAVVKIGEKEWTVGAVLSDGTPGERYYLLKDAHGVVFMAPATDVERSEAPKSADDWDFDADFASDSGE